MKLNYLSSKKPQQLWLLSFLLCLFMANETFAQNITTVSGKVTDNSGLPIPGANIVEKGTKNSSSTDFDGKFNIKVSKSSASLTISYVGHLSRTVKVTGEIINVVLQSEEQALKEIVVVGYGKVKKKDLTGSVSTLDAASITERSTTNVVEAMQGAVAGVQVTTSTGRVGDPFSVVIRGKNSINPDSKPLYVVDGVPTDGIDFLNPQDISRIDVLKDASSTAIYGSRGSNGVVIVTTKGGGTVKSKMSVSFDTFFGSKEVARLPKMMSGQKWWLYHQSAYLPTAKLDPATGTVTAATLATAVLGTQNSLLAERVANNDTFDWYDAVLKTGMQQNNYLALSGRTDGGLSYNLGLGIQSETGNIENESLDKYTFKLGLNHKINDKFSTGVNLTIARTEQELGSALAMQEAFRLSPFYTPYDLNGNLFPLPGKLTDETGAFLINKTSTYNPLLEIANSVNTLNAWNTIGNIYFEYKPINWLTFKTTYSAGFDNSKQGRAWGAKTNTGVSNNNLPSADITQKERFNYTWDNQFNIDYALESGHTFNFLGLQSLFSQRNEGMFAYSSNMPFDTGFHNLGSGKQSTYNLDSYYDKNTLASFAARFNYGYKDRYLITLSNRWDGSSKFAEGNKWGSFPSAAFAWRAIQESFMKNQNIVSDLKARISYGFTGNNIIPSYATINQLDTQTYYDFSAVAANGWIQSNPSNSNLGWEKTREFNVGLDFGFLNNRVSGTVDVYDRLSTDLLLKQKLVIENGFSTYINNIGSVSNKGVEVMLTTKNIETDLVKWETTFVFTKNTNKIISIYDKISDDVGNNLFIGESIDALYNYKFTGVWQASEAAEAATFGQKEGQAKVEDFNNDGKITTADRQILGNNNPDWTGSITTKLKVGNFDLSAVAITSQGVLAFSPFHRNFTDVNDRGRQKLDIDWYIPANDAGLPTQFSNSYPQAQNPGTYWINDGVGYYKDASFVKIKTIALGYTFTPVVLEKLKLKHLRLYVNVLNPFVFTKYDGYDPEWASASFGVGRVSSITYQMGMSIKF